MTQNYYQMIDRFDIRKVTHRDKTECMHFSWLFVWTMVKIDHVSSDHTENRKLKVIQHFSGQNSGPKSTNFPTLFTTKETIAWTVQLSWPALETRRLRLTDQGRLGLLNRRNGSIVTISAKNSNDSQNAYNNNVLVGWRMLLIRIAELSAFKM